MYNYRGFFIYPYQHTRARVAAGCATEVEFAVVCAEDMQSSYGANTVVIATGPRTGNALGSLVEIADAYLDAGMHVLLYIQGDYFFRPATWTSSILAERIAGITTYLAQFDTKDWSNLVGVCVCEESFVWQSEATRTIHPLLREYWRAIKNTTHLPLFVIHNGYLPYLNAFAALPRADRPDVYLLEAYAPLYISGSPYRTSDEYLSFIQSYLDNGDDVLLGLMEVAHLPLLAGIPEANLAGAGWEYLLVPDADHYLDQVRAGKDYRYQLGWYYVQNNSLRYLGVRDDDFEETALAGYLKRVFHPYVVTTGDGVETYHTAEGVEAVVEEAFTVTNSATEVQVIS